MNWGSFLVPVVAIAVWLILMVLNARTVSKGGKAEKQEAARPEPPWADDPIAKTIEWAGTSDWTDNPKGEALRIRSVSHSRIELQPTSASAFHVSMLVIGVAGAGLIYFATHSFTTALLAPGMFMGFSFVVWLVLHLVRKPLVFDKRLALPSHS